MALKLITCRVKIASIKNRGLFKNQVYSEIAVYVIPKNQLRNKIKNILNKALIDATYYRLLNNRAQKDTTKYSDVYGKFDNLICWCV